MAAAPLFLATNAILLEKLRLSDMEAGGSGESIVDQAIGRARLDFYRRLGGDLVATLVALTPNATPTTEDEIKRFQAEDLEVMLVRADLLRNLPSLWADSSADAGDVFQGEEAYKANTERVNNELDRLATDIENGWLLLEDTVSLGNDDTLNTFASAYDPDLNPTGDRIPGNRFFKDTPLEKR